MMWGAHRLTMAFNKINTEKISLTQWKQRSPPNENNDTKKKVNENNKKEKKPKKKK